MNIALVSYEASGLHDCARQRYQGLNEESNTSEKCEISAPDSQFARNYLE